MTRPASVDSSLVLSRSSSLFFVVFFALSHFSMAEQQSAERADSGSPRSRAVAAAVAAAVAKANSCNDESSSPTAQAAAAATPTTTKLRPLFGATGATTSPLLPTAQDESSRLNRILRERASFELREEDIGAASAAGNAAASAAAALARDLAAGARLSAVPAPPLGAAEAAAAEEMREWKVR